jgi:hypothetical protein
MAGRIKEANLGCRESVKPKNDRIVMDASWDISIREVPASGLQAVLMAAQPKNAITSQKAGCQTRACVWYDRETSHTSNADVVTIPIRK